MISYRKKKRQLAAVGTSTRRDTAMCRWCAVFLRSSDARETQGANTQLISRRGPATSLTRSLLAQQKSSPNYGRRIACVHEQHVSHTQGNVGMPRRFWDDARGYSVTRFPSDCSRLCLSAYALSTHTHTHTHTHTCSGNPSGEERRKGLGGNGSGGEAKRGGKRGGDGNGDAGRDGIRRGGSARREISEMELARRSSLAMRT